MKGFSYHHRKKKLLQRRFRHLNFLMKSYHVTQQQKWWENRGGVCVFLWGNMCSPQSLQVKIYKSTTVFLKMVVLPSFKCLSLPSDSDILWLQMFTILYLGVLLHHLMGFLLHAPHYFDINSSLKTLHLLHCMSLSRRTMMILWHLWLKSLQPSVLIFTRICIFQWKADIFHLFLSVKSLGVCQNTFSSIFLSISFTWEAEAESCGKGRSSFTLGYGFEIAILPQTGGPGISGCLSGEKGREKKTICSLKLQ